MRKLRVDAGEIAMAMEMQMFEDASYLDTETGQVVVIPYELRREDIFEEEYVEGLPAWERDLVPLARKVFDGSDRYAAIPTAPPYEEYDLMVEFADSIADPRLRHLLSLSLDGKGAFGRFTRVLEDHPRERDRWLRMRDEFSAERVREWLRELGIEPLDGEESP